MKISELDSFKKYEVKNMITIKGGEDAADETDLTYVFEEEKPWWHFW